MTELGEKGPGIKRFGWTGCQLQCLGEANA